MSVSLLALFVGLTGLGHEEALDAFAYADSAAAARAWVASSGTPAVTAVDADGRKTVEVFLPFAKDGLLPRSIHDRDVTLDLTAFGAFVLHLATDHPDAVGHVSLYFRSGEGWYSGSAALDQRGRQTLRFSKASFRTEGKPAGWHKIDGIRISFWRGTAKDARIRLERLAAVWHDVALVVPSAGGPKPDREVRAARQTAELVAEMLSEIGLGADTIDESAFTPGTLAKRRVILLPHNPQLRDETIAGLVQFVKLGGKLVVCYQLPPRLGEVLGFGNAKYFRPDRPEQLAEIRFEAPDVPGLPKAVRQNSWNITVAEPIAWNAKVIGRWYDADGKPTGYPAMLVSDRGAFFSHILLSDDAANKRQMLAAVLGRIDPSLWEQMVHGETARLGRVGHLASTDEVARYVKGSKNATAAERLEQGLSMLKLLDDRLRRHQYPEAIDLARQTQDRLAEAYLRAAPSRAREGRAFWNHSGMGAYPGDWDRTCKELAAGGFNMVLPNMLWGGLAHYASDVLPRSRTFAEHGDQIAQCVAAAKKYGIEVHVWKVNYNLSTAPRDFTERMRRAQRTQVSAQGEPVHWLCPSHPENLKLELESMLEVARKYEVDGLHFDYIRYPDGDACYCDGCRQRFEKERGEKVAQWPGDCYRGTLRAAYRDWRCQQITRLVEAVSAEARKIKPGIKISAAVFSSYPGCRESVGQDWPAWVKAGYVDFLCPMDYTESDLAFQVLVASQLKLVEGRVPIYPGIGATASRSVLSPDRVAGQIHHARELGAAGFTVFNLDRQTIGTIVPGVGLGAGARRAVPPHRK